MRASLLVSPIVAASLLAGCSSDTSLPFESGAQASPSAVAFNTAVLRTAVGDTARLHVIRSRGASASAETIHWRVANPEIAGIEDGLVFPLSEGATEITASVAGGAAVATVVTWGATQVSGLSITPSPVELDPGATKQLDAELSYSNGLRVKLRTSPTWKTLNASIAKVANGKVTGVAAGETRLVARMGAVADTIVVTIAAPVSEPVATEPAPPQASPSFTAPELPRVYLSTDMPAVTGRSIRVAYGDNLQSAINAAEPGDELVLDAGATYTGTFTLRKKPGDGWITIRSSGSLPPEGVRVTPADAPKLARLVATRATEPVIKTDAGAHHYRLIGLEITAAAGATNAYSLVSLGDGASAQNTMESQPHHLVLDRVYIHGTPTLNFQRCVALNSASTAIIDSWLSECHGKGFDSQAIGGWNGTGPYKIVNNHLAGAGENVMLGGADPKIPGALPEDIEIRRNHFIKPPEWKGVWSVKNLLELKIGRRVLVEGNVFENNWTDAQNGFAILFKSTNQSGSAPWSETSDVTFRYNIVRNVEHAFNLSARPEAHPAVPASRMLFENNVFDRVGTGDYKGGRLFMVSGIADLTVSHNTAISSHSIMLLLNSGIERLTITNNIFGVTDYGVKADGGGSGTSALNDRAPGWKFSGNVVAGARASSYPTGNSFPAQATAAGVEGLLESARARSPADDRGRLRPPVGPGADLLKIREATRGAAFGQELEVGVKPSSLPVGGDRSPRRGG